MKKLRVLMTLTIFICVALAFLMQAGLAEDFVVTPKGSGSFSLTRGESTWLEVTYTQFGGYWSVSDTSVLRIDDTALSIVSTTLYYQVKVTALKTGTSIVRLHNSNGTIVATGTVTVTTPITAFDISRTSLYCAVGAAVDLSVTITPSDADSLGVTWSSSNSEVAGVDESGHVTAHAVGDAVITATSSDGIHSGKCTVHVVIPTDHINVPDSNLGLTSRTQPVQIDASVFPEDATEKALEYQSSNTDAATVSQSGLVTGHHNGDATITIRSKDGFSSTQVNVHVSGLAESVSISKASLEFSNVGQTSQLSASVSPDNALLKNIIWASTDQSIATVSGDGLVKSVAPGTAQIYAYTEDGIESSKCTVTVHKLCQIRFRRVTATTDSGWYSEGVLSDVFVEYGSQYTLPTPQKDGWNFICWYDGFEFGHYGTLITGPVTITHDSEFYGEFTPIYPAGVRFTSSSIGTVNGQTILYIHGSFIPEKVADGRYRVYCSDSSIVTPTQSFIDNLDDDGYLNGYGSISYDANVLGIGTVAITVVSRSGAVSGSKTFNIARDNEGDYYILNTTIPQITLKATSSQVEISFPKREGARFYKLRGYKSSGQLKFEEFIWDMNTESYIDKDVQPGSSYSYQMQILYSYDEYTSWSSPVTVKVPYPPKPIPVTKLKMNKTNLAMVVGSTAQLSVAITPSNATDKSIAWSTNKASVATVDAKGRITAKGAGTATITAKSKSGVTAKCQVTVKPILISKISLNFTSKNIVIAAGEKLGKQVTLTAKVQPSNATNRAVNWGTSNSKVAKVDKNGVVTCVGYGKAIITATGKDGSKKKASCTITVSFVPAKSVKISGAATMVVGGKQTLIATVLPANAFNKAVTWTVSDKKLASIDAYGNITALGKGTVIVKAVTKDGSKKSATFRIIIH